MPYVKENSRFRFQPDEWLTTKQIKSFFSTLTSNRRRSSSMSKSKRPSRRKQVDSPHVSNSQDQDDTFLMETNTQDTSNTICSTSEINQENDDETEEETEEDFDAKLISMDIDDILDSAKKTLTLHTQQ